MRSEGLQLAIPTVRCMRQQSTSSSHSASNAWMSFSAQLLKLSAVIIYQTRLHMPANSAQGIVEGVGYIMAPVDGGRSWLSIN